MPLFEYEIVAGWNDAASMVNIESLSPAGVTQLRQPPGQTYAILEASVTYRRGERRFSANGGTSYAGYATVTWPLLCSHEALTHFYDTYSGQCTVRTTTGDRETYSNWNAYVLVPDPVDCEPIDRGVYRAPVTLYLVEAPT